MRKLISFCDLAKKSRNSGHHKALSRFNFDLQSWFQQLVRVMKLCTRPVVLTLTFSWLFCKVTKTYKFSHIGHYNSLNRLTLTFDYGCNSYLGWRSCAQDLLFWPCPFLCLFARSQQTYNFSILYHERIHFMYTITHWTVWHWPSIMVSTVS